MSLVLDAGVKPSLFQGAYLLACIARIFKELTKSEKNHTFLVMEICQTAMFFLQLGLASWQVVITREAGVFPGLFGLFEFVPNGHQTPPLRMNPSSLLYLTVS